MDGEGTLIDQVYLSSSSEIRGIELPPGTYHTLLALAKDTVTFELKEGPYNVKTDKEFLDFFPEEGTPEAETLATTWQQLFQLSS
jgi:cupin fold WbuC family metalloprotein